MKKLSDFSYGMGVLLILGAITTIPWGSILLGMLAAGAAAAAAGLVVGAGIAWSPRLLKMIRAWRAPRAPMPVRGCRRRRRRS